MPFHQGFPPGGYDFTGYQGFEDWNPYQQPQYSPVPPMVVIPQQTRTSNVNGPAPSQSRPAGGDFYQQYQSPVTSQQYQSPVTSQQPQYSISNYYALPEQQQFYAQSFQQQQPVQLQSQNHLNFQANFHDSLPQAQSHQNVRQQSSHVSNLPQVLFQQPVRRQPSQPSLPSQIPVEEQLRQRFRQELVGRQPNPQTPNSHQVQNRQPARQQITQTAVPQQVQRPQQPARQQIAQTAVPQQVQQAQQPQPARRQHAEVVARQPQPQQPIRQPSHHSPQLNHQNLLRQPVQTLTPIVLQVQQPQAQQRAPSNHAGQQLNGQSHQRQSQQRQTSSHPGQQLNGQVQQRHTPSHQQPSPSYPVQQQTPHRVVAHVGIPIAKSPETTMARSPKRRRSNEGHTIHVDEGEGIVPAKRTMQPPTRQAPVASSPLTELTSSQLPATPQPSVDYQGVLLSLADEYTAAAYELSTSITVSNSDDVRKQYCNLMATAMSCLESVLNSYRQPDPRKEARIRLRLGSLLVDETDNDEKAQEVLTKGISLCERSRLPDLKYAMHHVLVRGMVDSEPRAALKSIDKLIQEVESLSLAHWMYTFRFLRVSLTLEMDGSLDTTAVLRHLHAIAETSEENRHISVQIIAAILEAIVHLRSGSADAVDLAQRAMAAARTHQLGAEMQAMPQVEALLDCLDLACSLLHTNDGQVTAKVKTMQQNFDARKRDARWNKDGSVLVQLNEVVSEEVELDTGSIMRRGENGEAVLVLKWITWGQLYALGYFLNGFAHLHNSSSDDKAEGYLSEGLKLAELIPGEVSQSLAAATDRVQQQSSLDVALRLHLIFAHCGRHEWVTARNSIAHVRKKYKQAELVIDPRTERMLLYLDAMCKQGMGELQAALNLYQSPALTFEPGSKISNAEKYLRTLATIHSIFILRTLDPQNSTDSLILTIEPYCTAHPNKSIFAIFQLIRATEQSSNLPAVKRKQFLQVAVQAARAVTNGHLLSIVMNTMTSRYFRGFGEEQAESAAKAGRTLAKKARDKLWTALADGMYGDVMEGLGRNAEALAARREAQGLLSELPEALKNGLGLDGP